MQTFQRVRCKWLSCCHWYPSIWRSKPFHHHLDSYAVLSTCVWIHRSRSVASCLYQALRRSRRGSHLGPWYSSQTWSCQRLACGGLLQAWCCGQFWESSSGRGSSGLLCKCSHVLAAAVSWKTDCKSGISLGSSLCNLTRSANCKSDRTLPVARSFPSTAQWSTVLPWTRQR